MSNKKPWWAPIFSFTGHVLGGAAMFVIFGAAAILIAVLVQQLQSMKIPGLTLQVLKFVEYALLIADAFIFLTYTVFAAWKTCKEMTK